jgi:tRNA nucleotidyltransferase (CCA-adding enzyme)
MMLETSIKVLRKLEEHGFEAYVVGGFVRDYYMGKKSLDVDVCTNATPYDISRVFKNAILPLEKYGSVTVICNNIRFEITTYRKEIRYKDNRKPVVVEYINNLLQDLRRRDFTVNSLCMNSNGEIIDLLNGKKDIDNQIIKMIGNPDDRIKEDILRTLRAIRFATILNFKLDKNVKIAIVRNKKLLEKLSSTRKKEELTRIFISPNAKYGIELLRELKLEEHLGLSNLKGLKVVDDILGMWAQLNVLDVYPFSTTEEDIITKIKGVLSAKKIDSYIIYKYGLYTTTIGATIRGIDKRKVIEIYNKLPIKSRQEIDINIKAVCRLLNKEPGRWIKRLYDDLETKIIYRKLANNEKILTDYIIKNKKIHTLE